MKFIDVISSLPVNASRPYKKRDLAGVDQIVIHQTDGYDKGLESAVEAANYHVNTKGWGGIAYHVFVTDEGKKYLTNELDTLSYHAGGNNTRSVGITVTGRHRYEAGKTNEEIIGIKKYKALVDAIVKTLGMLPRSDVEIVSHADVSSSGKTDPNLNMDQLREDVKKKKSLVETSDSDSSDSDSDLADVENKQAIRSHLETAKHHLEEVEKLL